MAVFRLQRLLTPRRLTALDAGAICAAVLGAWVVASEVQQRCYGTRFSPVPYDVFLVLLGLIGLAFGLISIRAVAELNQRAKQLHILKR